MKRSRQQPLSALLRSGTCVSLTRRVVKFGVALITWLALAAATMAQPVLEAPPSQEALPSLEALPAERDTERFSMTIEQLELAEVIELLAQEWALTLQTGALPQTLISINVSDATLQEVLAQLLHPYQLDFRLLDAVLRIDVPEALLEEDASRRRRHESMMPLKTAYLQVNYANAEALGELVNSAEEGGLLSWRGSLQVDSRTNTLIVRDIATHVEEIRRFLRTLDVPVSQVLIEARIVSASLDTGRELGVRWGMVPVQDAEQTGAQYSLEANRQGTQVAIAVVRSSRLLEWELSALEHQGEAELIARPRLITQDNTKANIRSGIRLPYQAQAGGTAGGSITQFVDAVLSLEVTPMITPDARIIMQLHLRQDSVASGSGDVPAINTNTIDTRVLIENNDTLVLGGIFREEQVRSETGTPLLRRLPGVGRLFRRETFSSQRTELLIFITPRIVELSAECC